MEPILSQLSYFVPLAVVNDRNNILQLFTKNKIVVDPNISDESLTELIMNQVFDSENFRIIFDKYIKDVAKQMGYQNAAGEGFFSQSGGFSSVSSLLVSGLGYLGATQVSKDQKAIANSQAQSNLALAQAQMQSSQTNLEIAKLQLEAAKANPQNNTILYVVLAVAGLLAIGGVVFAVTRKK